MISISPRKLLTTLHRYDKKARLKTGAHKEVFAIALMIFSQKCYGVSIDNVTAL